MEKKVLSIQDLSLYGQCSSLVANSILSAFGYQITILPTYIFSQHTAFKTFHRLSIDHELDNIIDAWKKENINFNTLVVGYLGNEKHIEIVKRVLNEIMDKKLFIFDPAFGDNGKTYPGLEVSYINSLKSLLKYSDIIVPNLTEACVLAEIEYKENYNKKYVEDVIIKLNKLGAKNIIITNVSFDNETTGVYVYDGKEFNYYKHIKLPYNTHGTGDVFTSYFTGSYLRTNNLLESVKYAADFVLKAMQNTITDKSHWYGIKYEELLVPEISKIKE